MSRLANLSGAKNPRISLLSLFFLFRYTNSRFAQCLMLTFRPGIRIEYSMDGLFHKKLCQAPKSPNPASIHNNRVAYEFYPNS
jgi:hypothetical protein